MDHRANHLPLKLSVGERQRVAIARSLANDPILLLADEPTGNLDSRRGKRSSNFRVLASERGMTIVLITHDPDLADRAGRIIRMQDGRLKSDGLERKRGPTVLPPFAV